jgi:hypothetical protein
MTDTGPMISMIMVARSKAEGIYKIGRSPQDNMIKFSMFARISSFKISFVNKQESSR